MRQDRPAHGTDGLGLVRHVLDGDGGQVRAAAVVLRVKDERRAAAARCPRRGRAGTDDPAVVVVVVLVVAVKWRHRAGELVLLRQGELVDIHGINGRGAVSAQPAERVGQVVCVGLLVGRALEAHLPVVGRRGRRADEEELAGVGQGEARSLLAGVGVVERRGLAEVDAAALSEDGLAVQAERTRMAASSSKKETTMRRKDLRGAQLCTGAVCATSSRIVCRLSGRKMAGSCRLVKRRVLEGGVGAWKGGRFERSSDREALGRVPEEREEKPGRASGAAAPVGDGGPDIVSYVVWREVGVG